ncbi:hypothetical protein RHSIM_Rhsim02G0246600 [Rhododendron simsii]|uniref:Protein phosphatase n=1 Tax=Rhododendron simsii TaxID=118357 RepID=A0A834HAM2_RHOSS|nr:hypothetical protein RHSIM_Rhsim02G0246600 [Rhododendron simsii]
MLGFFSSHCVLRNSLDLKFKALPLSRERGLKMVCGAFYISKAKESKPQGDDAHFICAEKQTVGVADGVGGWSKSGVDAGQYARGLMANCVKAIENVEKSEVDPRWVLDEAYRNTNVEGSSTACILTLKNNVSVFSFLYFLFLLAFQFGSLVMLTTRIDNAVGYPDYLSCLCYGIREGICNSLSCEHVVVANVGDSGFMVIREGKEVFKSNIQQRRFNCPYQLGNKTSSDRPNVAQLYRTPVVPGDVIVMGTDGLLDNMFSEDICHIVKMITESSSEPEQAAWAIAEHAYNNSVDSLAPTPFTQASLMAGKDHLGGKADDITVIVAYVVMK